MESELDLLLGTAIDSLPKLEILVGFIRSPEGVRSAEEMATYLRRPRGEVAQALAELAQAGLVDRFALGTGKHVLYGPRSERHVRELLGLLFTRYQDPAGRAQVLRDALARGGGGESDSPSAAT